MLKSTISEEIPAKLLSRDKKTNETVHKQHFKRKMANERNKLSELLHNFEPGFLEPEYEGDHTVKVKQSDIVQSVNLQTAASAFDLSLNMGDYQCQYSRNGATLMLTSSQGHLSLLNWREKELLLEINLKERINGGTFLHNDEMLALCQPQNTFIYDGRGIELHKLPSSFGVEYLPYHFLLALSDHRRLKYYDITTGNIVADHTAKNQYTVMKQNKSNAVMALGTSKGVVEWWTPGVGTPAVQLFVGGKVDGIGFHKGYMYTVADQLKVWDTRMLKVVTTQQLPRKSRGLDVSDSGLVGINYGFKVQFFKDLHQEKQSAPYLRHQKVGENYNNLRFVPFEDLMGLGTSKGFSSIVVPGSGVPYFDTYENNPFETKKQKRESLVHKLLEKLAPQTITVDPNILGGISRLTKEQIDADEKQKKQAQQREHLQKVMAKNKMRGGSKISKKISKRQIELQKIKRAELTNVINTKMWAKRAERKKKQTQISLIQQIQAQGLGIADLIQRSHNKPSVNILEDNQ